MDVNQIICKLSSGTKIEKRNALKALDHQLIESTFSEIKENVPLLQGALVSALSDNSELNRKLACEKLNDILEVNHFSGNVLCALITVLHHRIGRNPKEEESEDVHHDFVVLLNKCLQVMDACVFVPHLNELILVYQSSLKEKSPDILIETMSGICCLARTLNEHFHLQSESLVKPLLKLLKHRRFKIRVIAIEVLGCIVLNGNPGDFSQLFDGISCCCTDIPQVKLALLEFGTQLATQMRDRYSYWPQILSLVLFGLRDEFPEVKGKAVDSWHSIGKQYELENEEELKELLDFQSKSKNYPEQETYFGVGCKVLVQRSLHSLLKIIKTNMQDWRENYRLITIKLLVSLVLCGQENIIQYSSEIIEYTYFAANDEEVNVAKELINPFLYGVAGLSYIAKYALENIFLTLMKTILQGLVCVNYIAYFIPPKIYLPFIQKEYAHNNAKFYRIFNAIIQGTPHEKLCDVVSEIIDIMDLNQIVQVEDIQHFISTIGRLATCRPNSTITLKIIEKLIYLNSFDNRANTVLEELALVQNVPVKQLVESALKDILTNIQKDVTLWTEESANLRIFQMIMDYEGIEQHLDIVATIMKDGFKPKNCPIMTFKIIESVRNMIMKCALSDSMEEFIITLLTEYIDLLLPWSPGKTAESLRTIAVSCSLCVVNKVEDNFKIFKGLQKSISLLPSLITDECSMTRELTCSLIDSICKHMSKFLDVQVLFSFTELLIERLEDKNSSVRVKAATAINSTLLIENSDWSCKKSSIEALIESMFIYLDDVDQNVQRIAAGHVKTLATVCPEYTKELINKQQDVFRKDSQLAHVHEYMQQLKL